MVLFDFKRTGPYKALWVPTAWSELLGTFPLIGSWTALGCEVKNDSNQDSVYVADYLNSQWLSQLVISVNTYFL